MFFACYPCSNFVFVTIDVQDEMLRFTLFDETTSVAKVDERVSVVHEPEKEQFVVLEDGKPIAIVPSHTSLPEPEIPDSFPSFSPPLFGVTTLGASTGFDADGVTSGLVLWINGRGIMVDPPPHRYIAHIFSNLQVTTVVGSTSPGS